MRIGAQVVMLAVVPPPDFQGCGFEDPDHSWDGGRLQYGDGLFETMGATDGRVRRFGQHMARLAEGLAWLGGLDAPTRTRLGAAARARCRQLPHLPGRVL